MSSFSTTSQEELDDCFKCGMCDLCANTQQELNELRDLARKLTPGSLFRAVSSVVYGGEPKPSDAEKLAVAGVRLRLRRGEKVTPYAKVIVDVLPIEKPAHRRKAIEKD